MATVGNTYYNLSDFRSRTNADGTMGKVGDYLSKLKPIASNLMHRECNNIAQHDLFIQTNLPVASTIQAGGGIPISKGNSSRVSEITGAVGVTSQVPKSVLDASGNPAEQRALSARWAIESVAGAMEDLFMNGDTATDPLAFKGLKTRLNSTSGELAKRVKKGVNSDADVNTSIYFVFTGEGLTYGLHPTTAPMGIKADLGREALPETLANGRIEKIYTDQWSYHGGLAIEDPRSVCRLCNISVTKLASGTGDDDLFDLMLEGWYATKDVHGMGKGFILANVSLAKYLDKQARANVTFSDLTVESRDGAPVTMYRGLPILVSDYITNTEALVS